MLQIITRDACCLNVLEMVVLMASEQHISDSSVATIVGFG